MHPSTESVQRLMEIGFVAVGNGFFADAESIFSGVQAARPNSELPMIGRAFIRISAGRHHEAVQILQQALEINPESEMAMTFLGAALQFLGLSQASEGVLRQVQGSGEAVELAKSLLEK